MAGAGGYYVTWINHRQTLYVLTYTWNLKNKQMNITEIYIHKKKNIYIYNKTETLTDTENKLVVTTVKQGREWAR